MLLPRLLRPIPVSGALQAVGPPGRSPLTLVSTAQGRFIGELLARLIADDGRWDRCAWLREPPTDPEAASQAMVDALALRSSTMRDSDATLSGAMEASGTGSVLVVELTKPCSMGLGRLLAEAHSHAERVGVEIMVASDRGVPGSLARAAGPPVDLGTATITKAEGVAIGLEDDVLRRVRRLTRGREAALHDLATAARWPAETIERAARGARTGRGFLRMVTRFMLDECWAHELDALEIAMRTGYWHPQFSGGTVATESLRPWLVPLEHDWGWVRPVWRSALRIELNRPRTHKQLRINTVSAVHADVWQPSVEIRVLGNLEIRVDGQLVEGAGSGLGTSLLRYLLVRPELSCPRDLLIEAFWPDSDPERARNRLQAAFSSLRRAIREVTDVDVIEFCEGSYRLNPDLNLTIDLTEFERLAQEARRSDSQGEIDKALTADRRAVRLYRGDLCSDLRYEEWTIFPRERTRLTYGDVLDRLARNQWDTGDIPGCISTAELMLEQDPCREDAHRRLMRCYAAQQRPHQALRQFDACRRVLKAALGTNPSRATVATYLEIRDRGDEPPPRSDVVS